MGICDAFLMHFGSGISDSISDEFQIFYRV